MLLLGAVAGGEEGGVEGAVVADPAREAVDARFYLTRLVGEIRLGKRALVA